MSQVMQQLKKYCPDCDEMHFLKEFSWIGNGMYGRSKICKKASNKVQEKVRQERKKNRDYFNQFMPI